MAYRHSQLVIRRASFALVDSPHIEQCPNLFANVLVRLMLGGRFVQGLAAGARYIPRNCSLLRQVAPRLPGPNPEVLLLLRTRCTCGVYESKSEIWVKAPGCRLGRRIAQRVITLGVYPVPTLKHILPNLLLCACRNFGLQF
jgi:hypothetical protein